MRKKSSDGVKIIKGSSWTSPEIPNIFPSDIEDDWPPADQSFFLYIHTDHLGSTNLVTEGQSQSTHNGIRFVAGEVVQRVEYMPFGKERYVLNPALKGAGPKFTGQTQDEEDGLYFYKSRYYDPVLGRFIQPDALILADASNPQTLNSYSYVLNNPLKYTDPTGQSFTDFDTHDEFDLGENERTEIDFLTGNEGMAMDRVKRDAERVDRVLAGEGTISDRDIAHAMGRLTLGESVNIGFEVDTVNNADFRSTLFSFIINNFGENNYLRNGLIGAGVWGGLGLLTAGPFGFLVGGVSGFFFGAVGTFYVHELIKNPSTVFWHFYTDKNTPTPDRNSNGVADVFE